MIRSLTGTRIRQRRRDLRISQSGLAREIGISPSYLNLIEHNKRKVAGWILVALAQRLGLDQTELSDDSESPLIHRLRETITLAPSPKPEAHKIAEFAGSYPGWASLLTHIQGELQQSRRTIADLSDRLAHDSFLAETMHALLTNITAIHATASILVETGDIGEAHRQRFLHNLHGDSQRLSKVASELADYFDNADRASRIEMGQLGALDAYLEQYGHHCPALEIEPGTGSDAAMEENGRAFLAALASDTEPVNNSGGSKAGARHGATDLSHNAEAERFVRIYTEDARRMPLEALLGKATELGFCPVSLARAFSAPLDSVLRRLGSLPETDGLPTFGFISCDISGSIIHRKELPGFPLPRHGSGCPLWPLYQSLTRTGTPVLSLIEIQPQSRFWSCAISTVTGAPGYAPAQSVQASMLFLPEDDARRFGLPKVHAPLLEAGPHCRLCHREPCPARRESAII